MVEDRSKTDYTEHEIALKIREVEDEVRKIYPRYVEVTGNELITYFEAESPYGDVTTLDDVLDVRWLLIHELVELSELKQMGLKVTRSILIEHMDEVNQAHVTAAECEFAAARAAGDEEYIKERIKHVNYWIDDEEMDEALRERCQVIIEKYRV